MKSRSVSDCRAASAQAERIATQPRSLISAEGGSEASGLVGAGMSGLARGGTVILHCH